MVYRFLSLTITLLGTLLKMLFLFQRWDMLVPLMVIQIYLSAFEFCFLVSKLGTCHSPGASDARFETTCVRCWETQSDC